MSDEQNPFAPAAEPGTIRVAAAGTRELDLDLARKALRAHTQEPARLEDDARARGPKQRPLPLAATALGAVAIPVGIGVAVLGDDAAIAIGVIAAVVGFLAALIGGVFASLDFRLWDRREPHTPEQAALTYWRALATRPAFAWTVLSPTARALPVTVPDLAPVVVTYGTHEVGDPATFKKWTLTFAAHGGGQQRQVRIVGNPTARTEGDYAETDTTIEFSSIPQWIMVVAAVGFVLIRLLGLIAFGVAYLVMRQKRTVTVRQRWLRGEDGAWYLLDAEVAV